jgi:hypothetical protein
MKLPNGTEFLDVTEIMPLSDFQKCLDNGWPVAVLSDYIRLVGVSRCVLIHIAQ